MTSTEPKSGVLRLAVIVLVLAAGGYYPYFWRPNAAKIEKLEDAIVLEQKENARRKKKAARLHRFQKELQNLKERAETAERELVYNEESVKRKMSEMRRFAKDRGFKIEKVSERYDKRGINIMELAYVVSGKGNLQAIQRFTASPGLHVREVRFRRGSVSGIIVAFLAPYPGDQKTSP